MLWGQCKINNNILPFQLYIALQLIQETLLLHDFFFSVAAVLERKTRKEILACNVFHRTSGHFLNILVLMFQPQNITAL